MQILQQKIGQGTEAEQITETIAKLITQVISLTEITAH